MDRTLPNRIFVGLFVVIAWWNVWLSWLNWFGTICINLYQWVFLLKDIILREFMDRNVIFISVRSLRRGRILTWGFLSWRMILSFLLTFWVFWQFFWVLVQLLFCEVFEDSFPFFKREFSIKLLNVEGIKNCCNLGNHFLQEIFFLIIIQHFQVLIY